MNDIISKISSELVPFLTIGFTFYLLSVALKNYQLKMQHPILSKRITKIALVTLFVSQFGQLLFPEYQPYWVLVFKISVVVTLAVFAYSYRKNYEQIKIAYVDHTDYLTIPTDRYKEVQKGVWLRILKPGFNVLVPTEHELVDIMKKYPSEKWLAIALKVEDGIEFPEHIHPKWEHTYLVTGKASIFSNYRNLTPEQHIEVPPITKHFFRANDYCVGVSFIQK